MSRSDPTAKRARYLPALDGLRGIAVIAVLFDHGNVEWARGAFLAVDAFFVLSGFLITTLLVEEWKARGGIDLRRFWSKRARRLLPALFLVIATVTAVGAFVGGAFDPRVLRGDGFAGLGYVANWRFIATGQSYFERFAAPSPLRHLWSLAIEEQFYLVWPFVVAAVLRVSRGSLTALTGVAAFLATASAFLMVLLYEPGQDASRVYYGTDTRAQSLLIGALVVLLAGGRPVLADRARRTVQLAGVPVAGVLVVSWATADEQGAFFYRGGLTLASVLTAFVILGIAQPRAGPVGRVLSIAPLRAAGIVSYGLYLWHWPVYVFLTADRTGVSGPALLTARLVVTTLLAVVSYVLLEQPIRRGAMPRLGLVLTPATAIGVGVLILVSTSGLVPAATSPAAAGGARLREIADRGPATELDERADALDVLIVGDSTALALGYQLEPETVGPDFRVVTEALLGCGLMPGVLVSNGADRPTPPECDGWPDSWRQAMARETPDVVVMLTGTWDVFDRRIDGEGELVEFGSAAFAAQLETQMDLAVEILTAGDASLLVLSTPCYRPHEADLVDWGEERSDDARIDEHNAVVAGAPSGSDRVAILDFNEYLCPDHRYLSHRDGVFLRDDGVHFTPEGANVVWSWLAPQILSSPDP